MTDLQKLDACNTAIALKKDIERNFLVLGEMLLNIRQNNLYYPAWEDFITYCWELDMSESKASKLINIYQKFIVEYQFSPDQLDSTRGWSSLAEALPLIKDKTTAEHYLNLRNTLTAKDYRETVRSDSRGVSEPCTHPDTYLVRVCRTCGNSHQEYEENQA